MRATQELEHEIRQSADPSLLTGEAFSAPDLSV